MPTFETTTAIDVNLNSFTDDELREELASRGEPITRDVSDFDEKELFAEVEARGYFVAGWQVNLTQSDIDIILSKIEGTYKIGSAEYFLREKLIQGKKYAKDY